MPFGLKLRSPFTRPEPPTLADLRESATTSAAPDVPQRQGYAMGVPPGGLNEYRQSMGAATQTDRRSSLTDLYGAYLSCPWVWAAVNAISRTITAGGLVTDWNSDSGEGDQSAPDKPAAVLALERLFAFCSPQGDIRQLLRNVITDLLIFGDAYIEVTWVRGVPVALYNLDCPTMYPIADEHGTISQYVQVTEWGQRARFEPNEVIHIGLDSPRSSVFGVSPTQAALQPITAWLHASNTGKEMFRKGLPPLIHVDFPAGKQEPEQNRWLARFMQRNVGPRNLGMPIATVGGAHIQELAAGRSQDVESYLAQKRDEILAAFGCPPSKAMVIESGNLGGGTGESQDRTFRVNTCQPLAELVLEKINYAIVKVGFGITDWHAKFKDIDWRDSKIVEDIRDERLRNGSWTLNRYRAEIGEPPVEGGDDPVLIDRQNLVLWADMSAMSKAAVAGKGAPAVAAGEAPPNGETTPGAAEPPPEDEDPRGESAPLFVPAAWEREYRARLREAMRELPQLQEVG